MTLMEMCVLTLYGQTFCHAYILREIRQPGRNALDLGPVYQRRQESEFVGPVLFLISRKQRWMAEIGKDQKPFVLSYS